MNKREKYLKILHRGATTLTVLVFGLLVCVLLAQAAPYFGLEMPFSVKERGEEMASAKEAAEVDNGLFGTIVVALEDEVSLPKAYLLLNGEQCGNFAQGRLYVRVHEGDELVIDATSYQHDLLFVLERASANIEREFLTQSLLLHDELGRIGIVHFK